MPDSVLTPAPVNTRTRWAARKRFASAPVASFMTPQAPRRVRGRRSRYGARSLETLPARHSSALYTIGVLERLRRATLLARTRPMASGGGMAETKSTQHPVPGVQPAAPVRRIGVLTGGGDCPGLNAVLRGLVKTAVGAYGWEVLGFEDGFDGLLDPERVQPLTLDAVRGILPRGGTILGTTNRSNPFDYVWKEQGAVRRADRSAEALARIDALGLNALVVVGGDGTLAIAERFHRLGMPVVGVPKTIDNDLSGTDVTFGYQTALETAME